MFFLNFFKFQLSVWFLFSVFYSWPALFYLSSSYVS
uniref:Uncharacterized protein n=1 Tax=Rhizophora mucronata TaxID=61149 RepID=A0A2P2QVY7_RHIMU